MTDVQGKMPTVPFGPHRISRLMIGSNQMYGASHNLRDLGAQMLEYFTPDQTLEFVRSCLAEGMNTWQANYAEKIRDVVLKLREEGEEIHLLPNAAPQIPDLSGRLRWIPPVMLERLEGAWDRTFEELKPIGVFLWGSLTDVLWKEGEIDRARDFLAKVRDAGVQVGVATHIPEVIEYIEEKGWDIDFYLASLYQFEKSREEILKVMPEVPYDGSRGMQLVLPSELPKMCDTIRKTPKTCIAFKLFAAGRIATTPEQVSDAFEYVFGHIKPTDAVCVGMFPKFRETMIRENADLVKKFG